MSLIRFVRDVVRDALTLEARLTRLHQHIGQ